MFSNDDVRALARGQSYLQLCVIGHHSLETNTDTLNDSQEDGAHDGGVTGSLDTTTDGQRATSEETSDNGVPGILLLANTLDSTVVGREQTTLQGDS